MGRDKLHKPKKNKRLVAKIGVTRINSTRKWRKDSQFGRTKTIREMEEKRLSTRRRNRLANKLARASRQKNRRMCK